MKIRFTQLALVAVMALAMLPVAQVFGALSAKPTSSAVLVDGKSKTFESYNINDFNYFKLRDIAYVLNGSAKQFAIDWDAAKNAMTLKPGTPYVPTGDEMGTKGSAAKSATLSEQAIFVTGVTSTGVTFTSQTPIEAYNIDDYNYFKLRDIGIVLDIGIGWDDTKNTISIDSTKGYVESQTVDALDKADADAIIANNKGLYSGTADFVAQAHITLKTVQNGSNITVYAMTLYKEFKKTGDKIEEVGGSNVPVAISFKKDSDGNYQLTEYWEPDVGDRYTPSIHNKFPKDLWDKVDTQFYVKTLQANISKQEQEHYKYL
ncbi:MAG: hypothetical protein LBL96_12240 [Clostridiales bacterium]|jgi:hypothetical protein|nr:hypothetical protein [Clostridiales bacterium]